MAGKQDQDGGSQMNRREMTAASSGGVTWLTLAEGAQARGAPDWYAPLGAERGFLSRENPLATVGQRAVENRAMALLRRPDLQRAHAIITTLWKNAAAWPTRDQAD